MIFCSFLYEEEERAAFGGVVMMDNELKH